MHKWIYKFSKDNTEGDREKSDLLGGKGANLAEMCKLGLPIPPGFTISTELCESYYKNNKNIPAEFDQELEQNLEHLEQILGKKFGCKQNPLLVSVRSGAKASMPGMMDTILNLGLNEVTVEALAKQSGNECFAYDSYRRFIQMYGNVVLNIPHHIFEDILDDYKFNYGYEEDNELKITDIKNIIALYLNKVKLITNKEFPKDTHLQLRGAIKAVLNSWMNERAITYRRINNVTDLKGTAVNIQAMVFGNMGESSATGVVFTRNPSNGEKEIYGEYLVNAQGEDVVAGLRTPQPLSKKANNSDKQSLEEYMPDLYQQLTEIFDRLEAHYKDMQDIEFTIEENKLWLLQTRSGKRTARAAIKIAHDLVVENVISKEQALLSINPESLNQLLHASIDENNSSQVLGVGLAASPGAATGIVVFNSKDAEERAQHKNVILVRNETSPEDIKGMYVAKGVLTARGGMTSHAAVVARGMGAPCVCGVNKLRINEFSKEFTLNNITVKEGDVITIDGSDGKIYLGDVPKITPEFTEEFNKIMSWAVEIKNLAVRANAETVKDVTTALEFGAEAIGLARTEHMFFDENKIRFVRQMIVAKDEVQRKSAIESLLPLQMADFSELLKLVNGREINIRLLDPPLHEFLPHNQKEVTELAELMEMSEALINARVESLREHNPMLGHRGCRLGITMPEIYEMQVKAIFNAAYNVDKEFKIKSNLEIMVPLIATEQELIITKNLITKTIKFLENELNYKFNYKIGTMIELPRAALKADDIAKHAEFFSFGTNDLTQTTLGISRDDSSSFINDYVEKNIYYKDPFVSLDTSGVGELVNIAVKKAKNTNANIKLGVCGEHGGDTDSILFFDKIDLDYISCSPYRVPIAIIAAAKSKLMNK